MDTGDNFRERFTALVEELELTDVEAARLLKVAKGTIRHWKDGVGAPHPLMQPSIFRVLGALRK